jgi:hypothetical protein
VSSGDLWVKDENVFWLWVSFVIKVFSNVSGGSLVGPNWIGLSVEGGASSGDLWILNEVFFWTSTVTGGGVTLSDSIGHYLVDSLSWCFIFFLSVESGASSGDLWILDKIFFWTITVSSGGVSLSDGVGHKLINSFSWCCFFFITLNLSVESGASSGDLWILNEIFFWTSTVSSGCVCLSDSIGHLLVNSLSWFGFIFLNEILSVECRMSSSNLWIKDENLLWLWVSVFVEVLSNFSGGCLVSSNWIGLSIE